MRTRTKEQPAVGRESMTPLMQQYREIKKRHENAILFFRMGDFYETFYDDAVTASRVLGITLTSRNNGGAAEVPLAGVPAKAVNEYVRRFVSQGFRVAICEQMEDPRTAHGVVKRAVVETVTPGAAFSDDLLDGARNNFMCAVCEVGEVAGVAAADISTGELRLIITPAADLRATLARLSPAEILIARRDGGQVTREGVDGTPGPHGDESALLTDREPWEFDGAMARDELARQYGIAGIDGFGLGEADEPAVRAAGALIRYLKELQPGGLPHLGRPLIERSESFMPLDDMTRRNLELTESLRNGATDGTLIAVLDRTLTPMGARLLRQWTLMPLLERVSIDARLDAVAVLVGDSLARESLRDALRGVRDLERLASKAASGRATPRELGALGVSLARLPGVENAARRVVGASLIARLLDSWDDCAEVSADISATLVDHPPQAIGDDPVIRAGAHDELDALRTLRDGGKDGIACIQAAERARTSISSLKVGYNKVFGYYISVTNANRHLVPPDYQRRQTLAGEERYVTPELKEFEERVLMAAEQIEERERVLFEGLRARAGAAIARLQCTARIVAELDVLASLAEVAEREGYVRPEMTDDLGLEIDAGRHPVVERMMPREKFIPNSVSLTPDARMIILTGPNMAGKSTILRQIGLIVLMAQMGSFVPASKARVGICDRVYTRVGASDNLVRGQSTFMVEMSETSAILHTATRRSLVLLDEIGRGTSTYDGVSIAWAVSEHLHDVIGCKTVFATHYHELTQLADELVAARNYNVAVREVGDEILFLHRLQPGGADRSYGIEVGRLAGLPRSVLTRARGMLARLEGRAKGEGREKKNSTGRSPGEEEVVQQLGLFGAAEHPVVGKLREIDVNNITPLGALELLAGFSKEARDI